MGMRVCKELHRDLIVHCSSAVLVQKVVRKGGATLSESCVSEDFKRLPDHLKVTLRWEGSLTGKNGGARYLRLLAVLGECKGLAHLDLSHNCIDDQGAEVLAGVLRECKALAHLDLMENEIGAEGAGKLAEVLGGCKALTHLDLSANELGEEGAGALAEVLGECTALTHLDL
eukprot:400010-Rhodomonas_salina.1